MIVRLAVALTALFLLPAWAASGAGIFYVGLAEDPFYEPQPVYTGLSLRDRRRPVAGAEVAMRETRVLSRALGLEFTFEQVLAEAGGAAEAVRTARNAGALAVLLDLPEEEMEAVLAAEGRTGGLLFNVRHRGDRWRRRDCAADLLHTIPSDAMLADALSQHLRAHGWDRVLLLHGITADDAARAGAVRKSLSKFGLTLAGNKVFELTNDPRRRDATNIPLLTGDTRYDVIWLVDSEGEFGRYVPFATYAARPVVGSEGLVAAAWHWTYERHGAPQLNQRFRRKAERDMEPMDWAAWVAVRSVVEGVQRTGSAEPASVEQYVRSAELSLDLYKGVPGSFRPWDGQLRQPVLLATHNAVIARAPVDGFEHRSDTLDTLGDDWPDSVCER